MKCCPACGQSLPEPMPAGIRLTPTQTRLYEIVRRAGKNGIGRSDLWDVLYANDANGGPDSLSIISVFVHGINIKIAEKRKVIKCGRGNGAWGGGGVYVLRDL